MVGDCLLVDSHPSMPEDYALQPTNRDNSDSQSVTPFNAPTPQDVWYAGVRRVNRLGLPDPRSSLARSSSVAGTVSSRWSSCVPSASHHAGYSYAGEHYTVAGNVITILASDGVPNRRPTAQPLIREVKENKKINYFQPLEANDEAAIEWRTKIAKLLARVALNRKRYVDESLWRLAKLPQNYTLYVQKNGFASNERNARTDYYLYGSKHVKAFRSPAEFAFHGKWLMDGEPLKANGRPDCECCYCSNRPQKAITKELRGGSGPVQDTQPSGPQHTQPRRTRDPKTPDLPVMAKDYRVNPPPMQ